MGTSRQFGGKPFARRLLAATAQAVDDTGRKIALPFTTLKLRITVTEDARLFFTQEDFDADVNFISITATAPFDQDVQVRFIWMKRVAAGDVAAVELFGLIK